MNASMMSIPPIPTFTVCPTEGEKLGPGHYGWSGRGSSFRTLEDERLGVEVAASFKQERLSPEIAV